MVASDHVAHRHRGIEGEDIHFFHPFSLSLSLSLTHSLNHSLSLSLSPSLCLSLSLLSLVPHSQRKVSYPLGHQVSDHVVVGGPHDVTE